MSRVHCNVCNWIWLYEVMIKSKPGKLYPYFMINTQSSISSLTMRLQTLTPSRFTLYRCTQLYCHSTPCAKYTAMNKDGLHTVWIHVTQPIDFFLHFPSRITDKSVKFLYFEDTSFESRPYICLSTFRFLSAFPLLPNLYWDRSLTNSSATSSSLLFSLTYTMFLDKQILQAIRPEMFFTVQFM